MSYDFVVVGAGSAGASLAVGLFRSFSSGVILGKQRRC